VFLIKSNLLIGHKLQNIDLKDLIFTHTVNISVTYISKLFELNIGLKIFQIFPIFYKKNFVYLSINFNLNLNFPEQTLKM